MTQKRGSKRQPYSEEMALETVVSGTGGAVAHHRAHCIDISHGGLGFSTSQTLRESQIVKISLPVKGFDAAVPVLAEVLWIMPENDRYRVGVRYLM